MTVRFIDQAGSGDQVATFTELCRKAPWANVTQIAVWPGARKGDPVAHGRIEHISKADGSIHDDPTIDVRAYLERCKAHQKAKKKAITFVFVVIGVKTANVRGKRRVEEPEETEFFTYSIRIGDDEDDEADATSPVDGMKVVAGLVKDLNATYKELLDRERGTSDWMGAKWRESMDAATSGAQQNVEMLKVMVGADKDKRTEAREERREREESDAMYQDAESRRRHNERMAAHGKDVLGFFVGLYSVAKGHTPPPPPPSNGGAPSDGSILGDLRQLFTSITPDEQSQMRQHMGDDLWKMIGAGLHAKDEQELLAIMAGMKKYIIENQSLTAGLMQAGIVISSGGRSAVLLGILKRAGVIGNV